VGRHHVDRAAVDPCAGAKDATGASPAPSSTGSRAPAGTGLTAAGYGRRRRLVHLTALAVPLLLSACATPPKPVTTGKEEFVLSGRLGARYVDIAGKPGELYGHFDWIESGGSIELTLIDPLGQAVARINAGPRQTSITLRSGDTYSDRSPEALTRRTLGWELPLGGLRHWLRGQGSPGADVQRDDQGRIERIRDTGWTIRYIYGDDATPNRRSRIDLNYPGPGPQIDLRLALDP